MMWTLTCDMQVKRCAVVTQRVLCQRGNTEDSSRLVDMLDAFLSPAQVGVRHGGAVAEIQLDVRPQGVPLKRNTAGFSFSCTWNQLANTGQTDKMITWLFGKERAAVQSKLKVMKICSTECTKTF